MAQFPFDGEDEKEAQGSLTPEIPEAGSGCPSTFQLEQYLAGARSGDDAGLEVHLQNCPRCRKTFAQDRLLRTVFSSFQTDSFLTELSQNWQPDLTALTQNERTQSAYNLPIPFKKGAAAKTLAGNGSKPDRSAVPLLPVVSDETETLATRPDRPGMRQGWQNWYAALVAGLAVSLLGLTILSFFNAASQPSTLTPVPVIAGQINNQANSYSLTWKATAFTKPGGITLDGQGQLYVADQGKHYIEKLDPGGREVARLGSFGTGNGQFSYPRGLVVDQQGNLYVADTSNNRIQQINSQGQWLLGWGKSGNADGEFFLPWNIALDRAGNVYVTDSGNNRVQKFDAQGRFLLKWGDNGGGDGQLDVPTGITIDQHDNVYIADSNNHRIQKFDAQGRFLLKWGDNGEGDGQFQLPKGLAVDASDRVYVVDSGNNRLQVFDAQGRFLFKLDNTRIAGTGLKADGKLNGPEGIAVDRQGNLYLTDTQNARLEKFSQP